MDVVRIKDLCQAAAAAVDRGDAAAGVALAREAAVLAAHGTRPHQALGMAEVTLAWAERALGDERAATGAIAKALAEARALEEADFEGAAVLLEHAARYEAATGHAAEATTLWRELISWHIRHLGEDHPRTLAKQHATGGISGSSNAPR